MVEEGETTKKIKIADRWFEFAIKPLSSRTEGGQVEGGEGKGNRRATSQKQLVHSVCATASIFLEKNMKVSI
jgi:hypothetical protein